MNKVNEIKSQTERDFSSYRTKLKQDVDNLVNNLELKQDSGYDFRVEMKVKEKVYELFDFQSKLLESVVKKILLLIAEKDSEGN